MSAISMPCPGCAEPLRYTGIGCFSCDRSACTTWSQCNTAPQTVRVVPGTGNPQWYACPHCGHAESGNRWAWLWGGAYRALTTPQPIPIQLDLFATTQDATHP